MTAFRISNQCKKQTVSLLAPAVSISLLTLGTALAETTQLTGAETYALVEHLGTVNYGIPSGAILHDVIVRPNVSREGKDVTLIYHVGKASDPDEIELLCFMNEGSSVSRCKKVDSRDQTNPIPIDPSPRESAQEERVGYVNGRS